MLDISLMYLAIEEAKQTISDVPVGAVLVSADGDLLAKSHNSRESSFDITGHAELNVLRQASRQSRSLLLHNCTLYVTLEPCLSCSILIVESGVSRVVFGAWNQRVNYLEASLRLAFRGDPKLKTSFYGGVLESDCSELLSSFFKEKRS